MDNHKTYRKIALSLNEKKVKLSEMKTKCAEIKTEIETLEVEIEEEMNGLNMIFDYLISQTTLEPSVYETS